MFAKLLQFELSLHFRQVGFWVVFSILFVLGLLYVLLGVAEFGGAGERVKLNGAFFIAALMSDISIAAILFGAVYVVSGIMRDEASRSLEIVHATPVTTPTMTATRMIGVFLAIVVSILAGVLGLFASQFWPTIDRAILGPVNLAYFLYPLIFFVGINALLVTGFFTAVAGITRDRTIVYVSAIGLFMLTLVGAVVAAQDLPQWITLFFDPLGGISYSQVIEYWSVDERNTRLVPLFSLFGVNRLMWGLIGLGLLVGTFGLFRRGLFTRKSELDENEDDLEFGALDEQVDLGGSGLLALWSRFKHEYLTSVRSVSFIVLMAFSMAIFTLVAVIVVFFDTNAVLVNNIQMSDLAIGGALIPLLIAVVFFGGEVIWRDRSTKIVELVDSTRVSNWPLMLGKWLAMFAVVATFIAGAMIVGMLTQIGFIAIRQIVPVNPLIHFQLAYFGFLPRIIFLAALVMFIQNFAPTRIAGMIMSGVAVIFLVFVLPFLPISHPMIEFGRTSLGAYSDINGFSNLLNYGYFMAYWVGICGVFGVLTIWLWKRGLYPDPTIKRLASFKFLGHLTKVPSQLSWGTGAAAVLFLSIGGFAGASLFQSFSIDKNYRSRLEQEQRAVNFEVLLGGEVGVPVPKIRSVTSEVYFSPKDQTARVVGEYLIENTTGVPTDRLFMSLPTDLPIRTNALEIDGAQLLEDKELADQAAEYGIRVYDFDEPLGVGETTKLSFETELLTTELGSRSGVRNNGTFLNNYQIMPIPGVSDQRLRNPDRRRKYDLEKIDLRADRDDPAARQNNFFGSVADYVDFSAKVCTNADQIPIAPGKFVREYIEDGNVCRDYKAINPILFFFSFLSADYEVEEDVWTSKDGERVDLAIYHHETHDYNIPLMIDAMKLSLDTYTEVFGPYQYAQVRIMEFPYGGFAQAFAGTIPFSENLGFIQDPGEADDIRRVDFASYVTMHEIGHQWFAHQIVPADTRGFNVLSEGLTENAAVTAYERLYGWQKTKRLIEWRAVQNYLGRRVLDPSPEPPLALAGNQQYLVYDKASWVFWGLKHYIGDDNMQSAIRAFLEEYGTQGPPYPTTAELVSYLRDAAGPDYQQLVTDYWDRITFWKLSFGDEDITVVPTDEGTYSVTFPIKVDKLVASEETGKERSVTGHDREEPEPETLEVAEDGSSGKEEEEPFVPEDLDEWIEVGFYTQDPGKTLGGEWMALERIKVTELETVQTITVPEYPTHIVLDPRRLLIEVDVEDNESPLPRQSAGINGLN